MCAAPISRLFIATDNSSLMSSDIQTVVEERRRGSGTRTVNHGHTSPYMLVST